MFLAFNLLLDLDVEDGVAAGDFGVSVQLDAGRAEQLGTIKTLGRRLAVLAVDHLTDITKRILRRSLATDHLQTTTSQCMHRHTHHQHALTSLRTDHTSLAYSFSD